MNEAPQGGHKLLQSSDVLIRPGQKEDWPFIVAPWLNNYRRESYFAGRITDQVFYANHHQVIENIVRRSTVLMACLATDPNEILGYIVGEWHVAPRVLHWIYVKKAFRRWGVATRLVSDSGLPIDLAGVHVSHPTKLWFTTKQRGPGLEEKFPRAIHNPYAAFAIKET